MNTEKILFIGGGYDFWTIFFQLNNSKHIKAFIYDDYVKDFDFRGFNNISLINSIENQYLKSIGVDKFIITFSSLGSNEKKFEIGNKLEKQNIYPYSFIHPSAQISKNCKLGKGITIYENSTIQNDVTISDYCFINCNCCIIHNSYIGNACYLMPNSTVNGAAKIGNFCSIGPGSIISRLSKIPDKVIVGANSFVHNNLQYENSLYYGSPAKFIRKN